jgi:hypothetical protein
MESKMALREYAGQHWQLHAVATGELDKDTRRNAFFLSATILAGDLSMLKDGLPQDFARVTQWLGDPESVRKLISSLRAWSHLPEHNTMGLAIIYPQTGQDSTIRCKVSLAPDKYTPSYDAIRCYSDGSPYRRKISVNDRALDVPDDTFRMLQNLRQGSFTFRLIWLKAICIDHGDTPGSEAALQVSRELNESEMYRKSDRIVIDQGREIEPGERRSKITDCFDSDSDSEGDSEGGSLPVSASISEHQERSFPGDVLRALESSLWAYGWYEANVTPSTVLIFFYGPHEFSVEEICEMSDRYEGAANIFESDKTLRLTRAFVELVYKTRDLQRQLGDSARITMKWPRSIW